MMYVPVPSSRCVENRAMIEPEMKASLCPLSSVPPLRDQAEVVLRLSNGVAVHS